MKIPSFFFPAHRNRYVLAVGISWTLWLALFFSYAFRVRLRIGHWPYFLDPQTMGLPRFPFHDAVVGYSLLAVLAVAVIWSVSVVIQAAVTRPHRPLQAMAALLFSWSPLSLGILADPSGLFTWYLD